MENRKPFKLRKVLIVYNLFQVIFSAWLFYEASLGGWITHYNYRCQPVEPGAKGIRVGWKNTQKLNLWMFELLLMLYRWLMALGGTFLASSLSFSTHSSSSWENDTIKCQLCTWYITALCHSAVSDIEILLNVPFTSIFFSLFSVVGS